MKTNRQEKRDERARDKEQRRKHRREREAFILAAKQRQHPDRSIAGLRWMPVPETEYECNQYGNIRKRLT